MQSSWNTRIRWKKWEMDPQRFVSGRKKFLELSKIVLKIYFFLATINSEIHVLSLVILFTTVIWQVILHDYSLLQSYQAGAFSCRIILPVRRSLLLVQDGRHLRANVCNFRESVDSREFFNFFIFRPNNLYSTLISKITLKLVTAFYFFRNQGKSEKL